MSFLEISDLTYTYPNSGVRAVDGLSLNADKGEIIAVIGPNAAGKSTFALLLKGLLVPDTGKIRIANVEREKTGSDPEVGILFSNPENQLVTSIVEEDVAFGLEVLGEPSHVIRKRVDAVLERLGIIHLRKRMPHLMSGGEQQMTALAGMLVIDPGIFVLDEPTTYLDPDARAAVLAFIRYLAEQGKIIFLVTHNMKEAAIADRVMLLDKGRVVNDGIPEEVFCQPELPDQYGIQTPFLLSLVLNLRSMGIDIKWPSDPMSLVSSLKNRLRPLSTTGYFGNRSGATDGLKEPALVYENVCFGYGAGALAGEAVLGGVDLSVARGNTTLLCGSNGSGKSTLLQMSNGLITPDRGQVLLEGRQLKTWKKEQGGIPGKVALLFQNPERQVFSDTVFEDIAFGPRNMGISAEKIEEKVMKAARWAGLTETIMSRPVFTLSGGQMRRVAIAGVLAMEPEVLVLDEPTDGLDPAGTRELFSGVRKYCDETGTTIVVAAHALPDQVDWIDSLGHLSDGRIQSFGTPADILTGSGRTLPKQYLPDHLILKNELLEIGVSLPGEILDPTGVYEFFLGLLGKSH